MLNKYLLRLIILISIIVGLYVTHTLKVKSAVEQAKVELNLEYQQKLSEEAEKARKTEHKLQEQTDRLRGEKDAQIQDISNKLSVALNELRNRPQRPSDASKDTGDTKACTGGELFREDAEFLTREAARADRILSERDYYYNQYEQVRRTLDEATH
jgi:hypothetical protein